MRPVHAQWDLSRSFEIPAGIPLGLSQRTNHGVNAVKSSLHVSSLLFLKI